MLKSPLRLLEQRNRAAFDGRSSSERSYERGRGSDSNGTKSHVKGRCWDRLASQDLSPSVSQGTIWRYVAVDRRLGYGVTRRRTRLWTLQQELVPFLIRIVFGGVFKRLNSSQSGGSFFLCFGFFLLSFSQVRRSYYLFFNYLFFNYLYGVAL